MKPHRALHHLSRRRATVNQIAQQNQGHVGRPTRGMIGTDQIKHLGKQIVAPVDVADGVDTPSRRYLRSPGRGRGRVFAALPEHD
ncbi:hypothetical protein [Sphingopyxis sp. DBS4]|uniref:hypothetical protein n=1 Tax=Sphingopyxis sp. DBS4 TaxID=2968500 RepID=UPI00214D10AF|nr:hypothetical protein [Sphingopyxis sp. DBS4]